MKRTICSIVPLLLVAIALFPLACNELGMESDNGGDRNPYACSDFKDNDGDGYVDFPDDHGCMSARDTSERGTDACDDGIDNDADTLRDYPDDEGCTNVTDNSEYPECSDGLDNDGDTFIDAGDPGCAGASDFSESVLKGPYLQNVKRNSVTIMWETENPAPGKVDYGLTRSYGLSAEELSNVTIHEVTLTGLSAETTYQYRISSESTFSENEHFRTAVETASPFTLVVYGDNRSQPDKHEEVVNAIIAYSRPDLVLDSGDMISNGSNYDYWGTQFFGPAYKLMKNTPIFTVLGNHENNSHWYYDFFANDTSSSGTESWYSFSYGNAYFIAMDSNKDITTGSPQWNWVENELKGPAQAYEWRFVLFHHPVYSSGLHGGRADMQAHLAPLFHTWGVDMTFAGHDHIYERSYKDGVYYLVSGGGGAPLYDPNKTPNPYKQVNAKAYHHLRININGKTLEMEMVENDGSVFDSVTINH